MQLRLFPDSYFILVGVPMKDRGSTIDLRVYDGTSLLQTLENLETGDSSASASMALGNPCATYISTTSGSLSAAQVELELSTGQCSTVAALSFPDHLSNQYLVRFPVHLDSDGITRFQTHDEPNIYPFQKATTSSMVEHTSFGVSGHRAVWTERRWDLESDNTVCTIMKAAFPTGNSGPVIVGPLLPNHTALPFQIHTCQSLALDEALGRVFIGLYTGDIYILEL